MRARRKCSLSQYFPKFSMCPVWSEPTVFHFRFEKAIASLKPTKLKTDPATHFWTVYKNIADEHDNDLVSKHVGDLDTSLLFVSAFTSLRILLTSTKPCCARRVYSRPLLPHLLSKLFLHSSRILPISQTPFYFEYYNKILRSVEPTRWHPSRISRSASSEPSPSSSQACPSHYSWLLSPCWGNSGSYIIPESRRGGTLSIEGRNARPSSRDSRSGDCT